MKLYILKKKKLLSMDAIECLKTRRSTRRFKDEPVKYEDLKTMLDCARLAPSGTNMQNWHFVVIRSKDVMLRMKQAVEQSTGDILIREEYGSARDKIAQISRFFTFFPNAPVVIAVLIDPRETFFEEISKQTGSDRYLAVKRSGFSTASGVAAAIENLLLAAHALGYGGCWMTGPLLAKHEIEQILGIKPPFELMALIPVGVPAKVPRVPERKSIEEITTWIE